MSDINKHDPTETLENLADEELDFTALERDLLYKLIRATTVRLYSFVALWICILIACAIVALCKFGWFVSVVFTVATCIGAFLHSCYATERSYLDWLKDNTERAHGEEQEKE